jgi:hypothetical protein
MKSSAILAARSFRSIIGDPKSVLRLGPVSPREVSSWTVDNANAIGQFLDVVRRIHVSAWFHQPHSLTSVSTKDQVSELLEAIFPDDAATMSVLAYFRQLHGGDKLLLRACDVYLAHVGDGRKYWWIDERKKAFTNLVDSRPLPFSLVKMSRRDIVRMFMYGGGLLHSESNRGDDVALQSFLTEHGKHKAVTIFNSCLMDFFRVAAGISRVIEQDFTHWISECGLAAPTRITIPDLFRGFKSPPRGQQS